MNLDVHKHNPFRFSHGFAVGLVLLVGAMVSAPRLRAHFQTQSAGRISFEVVSIKPAVPPPTSPGGVPLAVAGLYQFRGGRFRAPYTTAKALISTAFGMKDSRIIGGPDWIATSQYEVLATTTDKTMTLATYSQQLPALLRALLEERFGLRAHTEHRPFPVYALVKARRDGRLGPQLRPSVTNCQVAFCGSKTGTVLTRDATVTSFADILTMYVDRPVVDRTDLVGQFDIDLQWAPGSRVGSGVNAPVDSLSVIDGASLFTAIQEQLGLKLEPRNEPMNMVVIDQIERPTPN